MNKTPLRVIMTFGKKVKDLSGGGQDMSPEEAAHEMSNLINEAATPADRTYVVMLSTNVFIVAGTLRSAAIWERLVAKAKQEAKRITKNN